MSLLPPVRRGATLAASIRAGLLSIALATLAAVVPPSAAPALAAAPHARAVIVVGPTESVTASYIRDARRIAAQLRSLGAVVTEVYSPNATLARVRTAARGANLLVYLGHGNGFPNPYQSTLDPKKYDGMGLNITAGHGNSNKRYYGEYYMKSLALAPGAIVILNHACYTAGSSEPGRPLPTVTTARKRVDNFGAGFLRAGAAAVFATTGSAGSFIGQLFRGSGTLQGAFWAADGTSQTYALSFASTRTRGMSGILAPYPKRNYHNSIVGRLTTTVEAWRATWRP